MNIKQQGSELHRLQEMKPYNQNTFNKLYKICKPVIKGLTNNIDSRRLNVTKDIITSYFWDKFLFTFNKYQDRYEFEQLKANILVSLQQYSYKLMRTGYSEIAQYNQSLVSFDTLLDDSKEDLDIDIEYTPTEHNIYLDILNNYLLEKLTEDEFLVYTIQLNPPPFFRERLEDSGGKLTILHLIDFFDFERSRTSYKYFSSIKTNIQLTLEKAKVELNK